MKGEGRTQRSRRRSLHVALFLVTLVTIVGAVWAAPASAAIKNGKVLILDSTVSGGASSPEALAAIAAGFGVDVVNAASWGAMTTAQFAAYNALILGDATCSGPPATAVAAAVANTAAWGPAVDGNVITVGTDPVYHQFNTRADIAQVTINAVDFATAASGKTGMYIGLSCYYHNTAPSTPVPVLAPFGSFTVTGVGCYNDAHIVATHPALTGLTDTILSNWSCSVHEAFDSFPSDFLPLAIAKDPAAGPLPGSMSFPDGTHGVPYILARGSGLRLVGQIELTPDSATNAVGTSHTVTATVKENGTPISGTTVTFTVLSGPNAGKTGTGITNASGQATFTYTDTGGAGTDSIQASYVDSTGATKTSNTVTKTWESSAPTCLLTAKFAGPPAQIQVTIQDTGGLSSIVVGTSTNANTVVPAFIVGTTSPVVVTATKIDQTQGSVLSLTVTDVADHAITCDPRWPAGRSAHSHAAPKHQSTSAKQARRHSNRKR